MIYNLKIFTNNLSAKHKRCESLKNNINKSVTVLILIIFIDRYISEIQYLRDAKVSSRHLIRIHEEKEKIIKKQRK